MGREIRRVPPHWEHPRATAEQVREWGWPERRVDDYIALLDEDYDMAAQRWLADLKAWDSLPESEKYGCKYFWEWDAPPDAQHHRPKFTEEPTWWQVYETVSEGTPVSPPFATAEELIDYLAAHGDFWDQLNGDPPPSLAAAERFVRSGLAMSMMMVGGQIAQGIHGLDLLPAEPQS